MHVVLSERELDHDQPAIQYVLGWLISDSSYTGVCAWPLAIDCKIKDQN